PFIRRAASARLRGARLGEPELARLIEEPARRRIVRLHVAPGEGQVVAAGAVVAVAAGRVVARGARGVLLDAQAPLVKPADLAARARVALLAFATEDRRRAREEPVCLR